jgi:threonine synthase
VRYVSTRGQSPPVTASDAIATGLAPDGGLYVPAAFPRLDRRAFAGADTTAEIAIRLLRPFFEGDPLEFELEGICSEAFSFPAPLRAIAPGTSVLELFHGPTAAFKDFGARFLAAVLSRLERGGDHPLTILVATSGDTGGAVAAAFAGRPGFEVVVLYPKGMVSERQERQLTCWGGNVTALRVLGDFDACQRMVKEAFRDESIRSTRRLTSANSINLGRLLPQMVYYAEASVRYLDEHGAEPGFIIPSGNLGNATACYWAREVGLPIREVVLATNANETVTAFTGGGDWSPRPTVATLASAMDVGNPSNMERLVSLFGGEAATREALRAWRVEDDEIREAIRSGVARWGEVWDPHTATAVTVRDRIASEDWILVSTAHPAKFESVVEPLVGREVEIPPALAELLDRPMSVTEIPPELEHLKGALRP